MRALYVLATGAVTLAVVLAATGRMRLSEPAAMALFVVATALIVVGVAWALLVGLAE